MPDSLDGLRRELDRLREWRHREAVPTLAAFDKQLESLRGRTAALERRLAETEKSVAQMVDADKLAAAIKQHRGGLLTTWQRIVVALAAVAAVGAFVLQIVHAAGG